MDEKVLDSLTPLLNQSLTAHLYFSALLSVIAAGLGSYFGGYLNAKAQRRAAKEDFSGVLREQVQTTLETESVKSSIASAATRSLEQLRTDLQKQMAFTTFRRERLAKMKDMIFEAAVALDTLQHNCHSAPWLAKTSNEDIHECGHAAIARIEYAFEELREMQAIGQKVSDLKKGLSLFHNFQNFAGGVTMFKEEIAAGRITLLGRRSQSANDATTNAETLVYEEHKTWRKKLDTLRELAVSLSTVPGPSSE